MATVVDLSGNNPRGASAVDNKLTSITRFVTVDPIGVTTPAFVGEIVHDTNSNTTYRASTADNAGWVAVGGGPVRSSVARDTAFGHISV